MLSVRDLKALSSEITCPEIQPIKSPTSRTKLRKSAIMSGERGLRRESFIEASQKKGFYYLIGKRRIVC